MSRRRLIRCDECGHEDEMKQRRTVVVCDQCGATDDLVYSAYTRDQVPPRDKGWTSRHGQAADGLYAAADLCSGACVRAWLTTHTPVVVS